MALEIFSFILGPLENNTFILVASSTREAVVVDPALGMQGVLPVINQNGWRIKAVWLTHAHFDHTSGIIALNQYLGTDLPVGLHSDDLVLYHEGGGASVFGYDRKPDPEPGLFFDHGDLLKVGSESLEVRHTPGHTPGHVIFYSRSAGVVLTGDLIFAGSVGRTDLPGGNWKSLLESIHHQVFTLPAETRILSGHGENSSVGKELISNPFL